eukprot:3940237-Rhodomonas_salina.2
MVLCGCYAVCGTERAYGATRRIMTSCNSYPPLSYCHTLSCYAVCGTAVGYSAMRCPVLP